MLSAKEQLKKYSHKILWLASYPKSGNTWFRSILTALFEGEVDINRLHTDTIFSSRRFFDLSSDLDSRMLYDHEVKRLLPEVYRFVAAESDRLCIVKVHDAYSVNLDEFPIIPDDVTHKAVYIIRNPLDIATSFANHNNGSIDEAIQVMNNPNGTIAQQSGGNHIYHQFQQILFDWSSHVRSWTEQKKIEVIMLKYEDMVNDPLHTFYHVTQAIGFQFTEEEIQKAIKLCSFENLQKLEEKHGFHEKSIKSPQFFRQGKSGLWKDELSLQQRDHIVNCHQEVMRQYGYLH